MIWIPILAWAVAVALALVVLGFCGYELHWKAGRLRTDLARLRALDGELGTVALELAAVQARVADATRAR